jgi:endo-1,4-beta-xylanase
VIQRSALSRRNFIAGALASATPAVQPITAAETVISLAEVAIKNGVIFGSAINERAMANPQYLALLKSHCSTIVPETSLKWRALERTPGVFDFSTADQVAAVASRNNFALRGHTLLWHESVPDWVMLADDFKTAVQNQMSTVVSRFRGQVSSWDVVNEALEPQAGRSDQLRNSIYLQRLGERYVEWAFQVARQLDGTAQLVYNDYGCEGNATWHLAKRSAYLGLVRTLVDRSVPIDAVGFQAHLATHMPFDPIGWSQYLAEFGKLGLKIIITELDVNDRASSSDIATRDQEVSDLYERFLDATLSEPAVTAVLTWGLTDASTWMRDTQSVDFTRSDGLPQRPLLYDDIYRPKKAAEAVQRALASAPHRPSNQLR